MSITEFLNARLDEDERDARRAEGQYDFERDAPNNFTVLSLLHLTRWNPARVLAEVEAKRRIVAMHDQGGERWVGFPRADRREAYCQHDQQHSPCPTLRLLALPSADHPDYDEEWRP